MEDYGALRVVEALRLSPAGDRLLMSVRGGVWRNGPIDVMMIDSFSPSALKGATNLAWLDNDEIAFLKREDGPTKIWRYSLRTQVVSVILEADDPVLSFQLSPDGRKLIRQGPSRCCAYLKRAGAGP